MVQIRFDFLKGFEEFPIPKVFVHDLRRGKDLWVDWFGPYIHIDDYNRNAFTHGFFEQYSLSARSDEFSRAMIECFGNDMLFLHTLEEVKCKLVVLIKYLGGQRPFYENYKVYGIF